MTGKIREIRLYGDPVLRKKALPVTEFDDELKQLVADMFETMDDAYGAGLAAPQIGELKRVFVVNIYGEPDEEGDREKIGRLALINPEIIDRRGEQKTLEGCLSIPGLRFDGIDRAQTVTVRYQDVDGETHEVTGDDYLAQALQHEQDHLEGILYLDRLRPAERKAFMTEHRDEIAKMQRYAKKQLRKKEKEAQQG